MSTSGNVQFQMVEERGWRRGLGNLLQGEFSSWFKSTRWLKHLLVWVLAIGGMMAIMAYATADSANTGEEGPPLFLMYGIFGGMFVAFGVMIVMQSVVVGEKRSGTAAWVLSKPISRQAYILAKMLGNAAGIAATFILAQSLIGYAVIYIGYGTAPPLAAVPTITASMATYGSVLKIPTARVCAASARRKVTVPRMP